MGALERDEAVKRYRRLNAPHAAAGKAIKVYCCSNPKCEVQYERAAPPNCQGCGGIEFLLFPSKGEARHWAQLRQLEKRGVIRDLKRQVPFGLFAYGPRGDKIRVATYISDFTYFYDGKYIIADSKPLAGVDDLAALKLKMMECQGTPVTILDREISL